MEARVFSRSENSRSSSASISGVPQRRKNRSRLAPVKGLQLLGVAMGGVEIARGRLVGRRQQAVGRLAHGRHDHQRTLALPRLDNARDSADGGGRFN